MMGWLSNLLSTGRARDEAVSLIVETIKAAAQGAKDIAEIRERLARHATAGDLDKAITLITGAKQIATDFVQKG